MANKKPIVLYSVLSLLLIVLLSACGGAEDSAVSSSGKLLAWFGEGASPMSYTGGGVVGYLNDDGSIEPAIEFNGSMNSARACGNQSTSADGTYFAFMTGQPQGGDDGAVLYQVSNAEMPVEVDSIQGLTCLGGNTLRYGDDTLVYIDYEAVPEGAEYAQGRLKVRESSTLDEQFSADAVNAFALHGDSVAYIGFFTNARNQADESGIYIWNGSDPAREVATLFPESGCRFVSASLETTNPITPDDTTISALAVVMGERCSSGGTNWKIYTINTEAGTATLELSGTQTGGFFPQSGTNKVLSMGEGSHILFTTADGLTRNSASVYITPLNDITTNNVVVERGAVMSRHTLRRLNIESNAAPALSPDGRWLALAVVSGIDPGAIVMIDLTAPDSPPVEIPIPDTNDRVPMLAFSQDSSALFYVLGLLDGGDNALYRVDMSTQNESRVTRGQFQMGIVQTNDSAILLHWRDGRDYVDLVQITSDEEPITLYEGAILDDEGEVESVRFAYPLSWRE